MAPSVVCIRTLDCLVHGLVTIPQEMFVYSPHGDCLILLINDNRLACGSCTWLLNSLINHSPMLGAMLRVLCGPGVDPRV